MTIEKAIQDYEGSYMLGEADGQSWANRALPKEVQTLALIKIHELGRPDPKGKLASQWLVQQAKKYQQRDERFLTNAYFDGFLNAVRKIRKQQVFAVALKPPR
jgi:hypothetical protein